MSSHIKGLQRRTSKASQRVLSEYFRFRHRKQEDILSKIRGCFYRPKSNERQPLMSASLRKRIMKLIFFCQNYTHFIPKH